MYTCEIYGCCTMAQNQPVIVLQVFHYLLATKACMNVILNIVNFKCPNV